MSIRAAVCRELNSSGGWQRGYVYKGGSLLAVQDNGVNWVHQDPVTKSKRVTNSSGSIVSTVELDPWGADTSRSSNQYFQPRRFTTYDRDGNQSDEAMFRRYNRWHSRFDQPDPYDGSYTLTDPQSLNRYAYVQNDPVNLTDPTGLEASTYMLEGMPINCGTAGMFINSGAGVRGPLSSARYDERLGTFVHFTAVAASGGTAAGWIPQGYHYLGNNSWGWTDIDHPNANGDPTSHIASLKKMEHWVWRNGQWQTAIWGGWYNVFRERVGLQPQGVETDWNAQLAIGGLLNGVRGVLSAAASGLGRGASAGAATFAEGQLQAHFAKHGSEFGFSSATQYLQGAQPLIRALP